MAAVQMASCCTGQGEQGKPRATTHNVARSTVWHKLTTAEPLCYVGLQVFHSAKLYFTTRWFSPLTRIAL